MLNIIKNPQHLVPSSFALNKTLPSSNPSRAAPLSLSINKPYFFYLHSLFACLSLSIAFWFRFRAPSLTSQPYCSSFFPLLLFQVSPSLIPNFDPFHSDPPPSPSLHNVLITHTILLLSPLGFSQPLEFYCGFIIFHFKF